MAVYICVGQVIARLVPFYRQHTQFSPENRYETLDGLRGLLAFGVFFHHARLTWQHYNTGKWEAPEGGLYNALGPVSVAFFFAITAFLFWGKTIAAGQKVQVLRLLENRVRRIAPMYWCSLVMIGVVLLSIAGLRFYPDFWHVAWRAVPSLFLGLGGLPDVTVNSVQVKMVNAWIFWTLRWEWAFYFSLPVLAIVLRRKWVFAVFVLSLLIAGLIFPIKPLAQISAFLLGMCAAEFVAARGFLPALRSRWAAIVSIGLVSLAPWAMVAKSGQETAANWSALGTLLLAFSFLAVVCGNRLFGFLTLRGAKVLGLISYSVYLVHGIVLFITMRVVNQWVAIKGMSASVYWSIAAASGLITLLVSALSYRWIEYPWLHRKVARKDITPDRLVAVAPGEVVRS